MRESEDRKHDGQCQSKQALGKSSIAKELCNVKKENGRRIGRLEKALRRVKQY